MFDERNCCKEKVAYDKNYNGSVLGRILVDIYQWLKTILFVDLYKPLRSMFLKCCLLKKRLLKSNYYFLPF